MCENQGMTLDFHQFVSKFDLFQFGGTAELQVIEATSGLIKMILEIDEMEKVPQSGAVDVKCSYLYDGQFHYETLENDNEMKVLYKVVPCTEYNCSGTVQMDDEVIPIPEKLVFTHNENEISTRVHLEDVTDESFR